MAAYPEKPVTFGATIENLSTPAQPLHSQPSKNSDTSEPAPPPLDVELGDQSTNPFSAFYKHPEARRSMDEKAPPHSTTHLAVGVYETDVESAMSLAATSTTQQPKVSVDGRVKECTMWPSRQDQLEREKRQRRARGCRLYRNLNSRQRLWLKIIIGLLIVAAATGLGVGISRAVGGGVWSSPGQSKQID